jgi:hypothetical protein
MLAAVSDSARSQGMAYLASTYHGNLFDNVSITAAPADDGRGTQ